MIRSMHTINRNMNILQKKQENSGANIANVNTPGYKFQGIIQSTLESKDLVNFTGGIKNNKEFGLGGFIYGNQIDEVYKDFEQGILSETGKATDLAIVGKGFFTFQRDNGELGFTRNGNFKINDENQLVTLEGYPILGVDDNGQQNHIYVYNDEINVNNQGLILEQGINFLISNFDDYSTLNSFGDTSFSMGAEANNIIDGEVRQGYLELSNVSVSDELVSMIEIARSFEANQKLLHSANETLNKAVNEVGRV